VLYEALRRWLPANEPKSAPVAVSEPAPVVPPAPTIAAEDDLSDLQAIPGLDIEAGLQAVLGKKKRYRQLLLMFAQQHGDDVREIRESIAAENLVEARRIAHSLKGASAILGVKRVHEWAAPAEARLKAGLADADLEAMLVSLEMALSIITTALNQRAN
jgi:two-component system sensor histidine kinase/response regulator